MIRIAAACVGRDVHPSPFASRSVARHLLRGAIGLVALVAGLAGAALGAPLALLLLVITFAAWRGCPTCWALGLMETRAACAQGRCGAPRTAPR